MSEEWEVARNTEWLNEDPKRRERWMASDGLTPPFVLDRALVDADVRRSLKSYGLSDEEVVAKMAEMAETTDWMCSQETSSTGYDAWLSTAVELAIDPHCYDR
jgi:hypothetical protein